MSLSQSSPFAVTYLRLSQKLISCCPHQNIVLFLSNPMWYRQTKFLYRLNPLPLSLIWPVIAKLLRPEALSGWMQLRKKRKSWILLFPSWNHIRNTFTSTSFLKFEPVEKVTLPTCKIDLSPLRLFVWQMWSPFIFLFKRNTITFSSIWRRILMRSKNSPKSLMSWTKQFRQS